MDLLGYGEETLQSKSVGSPVVFFVAGVIAEVSEGVKSFVICWRPALNPADHI
jgi:hypothetical protein